MSASRRWRQYSMRTLLAVVLLAAIGFGLFRLWYERIRLDDERDQLAAAAVERLGGRVTWSWCGPDWVRRFGEFEVFRRATHLSCDVNTDVTEVAKRLADLEHLESVFLLDHDATPEVIKLIAKAPRLRYVTLNFVELSRSFDPESTKQMERRVQEVRQQLPNQVEVNWMSIAN